MLLPVQIAKCLSCTLALSLVRHSLFLIFLYRSGYDAVREIRRMEAEGTFSRRNYVVALTGKAFPPRLRF